MGLFYGVFVHDLPVSTVANGPIRSKHVTQNARVVCLFVCCCLCVSSRYPFDFIRLCACHFGIAFGLSVCTHDWPSERAVRALRPCVHRSWRPAHRRDQQVGFCLPCCVHSICKSFFGGQYVDTSEGLLLRLLNFDVREFLFATSYLLAVDDACRTSGSWSSSLLWR